MESALLVQGQGRLVLPHFLVQKGQVVQADGVLGVLLPQHLLADSQGLLRQGDCLRRLARAKQRHHLPVQTQRTGQGLALSGCPLRLCQRLRQLQPCVHGAEMALPQQRPTGLNDNTPVLRFSLPLSARPRHIAEAFGRDLDLSVPGAEDAQLDLQRLLCHSDPGAIAQRLHLLRRQPRRRRGPARQPNQQHPAQKRSHWRLPVQAR
jgi:hypothetical protein